MKLYELAPAEALTRREEFEPQIRAVYDGYHAPESTEFKDISKRLVPGGGTNYTQNGRRMHYFQFDANVAIFDNLIAAYFDEDIFNSREYLSEFYAWAYWREGLIDLPAWITQKFNEAGPRLEEKRKALERRAEKRREEAESELRAAFVEKANELLDSRAAEFLPMFNILYLNRYASIRDQGELFDSSELAGILKDVVAYMFQHSKISLISQFEEVLKTKDIEQFTEEEIRGFIRCVADDKKIPQISLFFGHRIEWKVTGIEKVEHGVEWGDSKSSKVQKQYRILWRGAEYEQEDFFKVVFGDNYKKFPKKARFNVEDTRLLSRNQWVKLQYRALAANYGGEIPYIHSGDAAELKAFYMLQSNTNQAFGTKAQRMGWFGGDGLRYMVAFGQGFDGREKEPTDRLFCYKQEVSDNTVVYSGREQRLTDWLERVLTEADAERAALGAKFTEDDCETIYNAAQIYLHYQDGYYMTYPGEIMEAVSRVVRNYVNTAMNNRYFKAQAGKTVESLSQYLDRELGEYRTEVAAEYGFCVRLTNREDVEIVDNCEIGKDMASYNKARGAEKMKQRAAKDLADIEIGEKIKMKDLIARGLSKPTIARMVKAGVLTKTIPGVYVKERV